MKIGAMNHPMRGVVDEIRKFGELGFEFVDLTLEPFQGAPSAIDVAAVARALRETGLSAVGHTAWYLPIGSPFERVRQAALDELTTCLDIFARLGITVANVHPDARVPSMFPGEWPIERNIDSLRRLADLADARGIRVMVENVAGPFNQVANLKKLFDAVPALGLHLDVGHANLGHPRNATEQFLDAFADRLVHVHFSDNKGDADAHLPMGVGTIDWRWAIAALKRHGYDGTIT
ncbi:MAG TPA: sugar phosphate isomerase/epimerase family protein, partial [Chloroflexota bacterium]|nr:sugar phosphate isomerase/epimerase family protein [Chloroflexota bacterium]